MCLRSLTRSGAADTLLIDFFLLRFSILGTSMRTHGHNVFNHCMTHNSRWFLFCPGGLLYKQNKSDFIKQSYWKNRPLASFPEIPHYLDTEPTSSCLILIMPSIWLGSDKYQFLSHWFDSTRLHTGRFGRSADLPKRETDIHSFGHSAWYSQLNWLLDFGHNLVAPSPTVHRIRTGSTHL